MTNPKLGKIISLVTSIFIVATGIALIVCASHLFFTGGDNPYSRESVGKYLTYLIAPAALTIALVIIGKIFDYTSKEKENNGVKRTESEMLESYAKRFDIFELSEDERTSVLAERSKRSFLKVISYSVSALFGALALVYILFMAEFTVENLSGDVLGAFAVVLPLIVAATVTHIPYAFLFEASAKKERAILLDAVKKGYKPAPAVNTPETKEDKTYTAIARYAILGIAALFIILGIINGGMNDVLEKAIKICTECIGLG